MSAMILALILGAPLGRAQQAVGTLIVEVRSGSSPAEQVEIQAVGIQTVTNNRGEASLELPAGPVEVRLQRFGFVSKAVLATVAAGTTPASELSSNPNPSSHKRSRSRRHERGSVWKMSHCALKLSIMRKSRKRR